MMAGDNDAALKAAKLYDEHVKPITKEQIAVLNRAEEQIVHGSLNVDQIRASLAGIESSKMEAHRLWGVLAETKPD